MIERKNQPVPSPAIAQPSAPKQAEALPSPATATEMYLAAILGAVQQLTVLIAVGNYGATVQGGTEPAAAESVEVELTEPVEQPKAKRAKK